MDESKDWRITVEVKATLNIIMSLIKIIQAVVDLVNIQVDISASEDDRPLLREWEEPQSHVGEVWMCPNGHERDEPGMCIKEISPGILCCMWPKKVERR